VAALIFAGTYGINKGKGIRGDSEKATLDTTNVKERKATGPRKPTS
jgi:hypothetical protein